MDALIECFNKLNIDAETDIKGNYDEIESITKNLTQIYIDDSQLTKYEDANNNAIPEVMQESHEVIKENIDDISTPLDILKIIARALFNRIGKKCGDTVFEKVNNYVF